MAPNLRLVRDECYSKLLQMGVIPIHLTTVFQGNWLVDGGTFLLM